jgi:hypothetical protein
MAHLLKWLTHTWIKAMIPKKANPAYMQYLLYAKRQPEAAYVSTFLLRCKAQRCSRRVAIVMFYLL